MSIVPRLPGDVEPTTSPHLPPAPQFHPTPIRGGVLDAVTRADGMPVPVTRADLDKLKAEILAELRARPEGIEAELVAVQANCPICGLRFVAPSLIRPGDLYEHPFDESPKLNGKPCELKGAKFRPPRLLLERVK